MNVKDFTGFTLHYHEFNTSDKQHIRSKEWIIVDNKYNIILYPKQTDIGSLQVLNELMKYSDIIKTMLIEEDNIRKALKLFDKYR